MPKPLDDWSLHSTECVRLHFSLPLHITRLLSVCMNLSWWILLRPTDTDWEVWICRSQSHSLVEDFRPTNLQLSKLPTTATSSGQGRSLHTHPPKVSERSVCVKCIRLLPALRVPKRDFLRNEVDPHCKPVDIFVIDWDVEILETGEIIRYPVRPPLYFWIIIVRFIRAARARLEKIAHELGDVNERTPIKLWSKKVHIEPIDYFVVEPTGRA